MTQATHTFKLPTGILCEVKEFTGKEQDIMTRSDKKAHEEKLNAMLKSIVVRVGSVNTIDDKFLDNMLDCDKNAILLEARQFTMDFDPDFTFVYKYTDREGNKQNYELKERIPEGHFPIHPMKVLNPDFDESTVGTENETPKYIPANYTDYTEVDKFAYVTLPKSGTVVRFKHLDGQGAAILKATDKNNRSSHTPLIMRNPVYFQQADKDSVPIQLNLNNLHLKDIEHLRKEIREIEGRVDAEIAFEHPEAEYKSQHEKTVIVNVLATVAFFFPSEAI